MKVKGDPQPSAAGARWRGGVRLADGTTAPADVHVLSQRDHKTWLAITLAEGKNRQVRRMCEAVGLPVEKLVRVAFGPLKLGKLPPGAWRHLTPGGLAKLRASSHRGAPRPTGRRTRRRQPASSDPRRRRGNRRRAPPPVHVRIRPPASAPERGTSAASGASGRRATVEVERGFRAWNAPRAPGAR